MTDFHSHILPAVDDGSRSLSESLAMLKSLCEQGVTTVVATPHFNANRESVDSFLARRDRAAAELRAAAPDGMPRLLCGAEVRYYSGISRLEGLDRLCMEGSRLLLLEMPMERWTEYIVSELVSLTGRGNIVLALAHVERYMRYQKADTLHRLYECGIIMQFNADFFLDFFTRRRAMAMLSRGEVHLIGSDCHNMRTRPPRIGEAFKAMENKLSRSFVNRLIKHGDSLLEL